MAITLLRRSYNAIDMVFAPKISAGTVDEVDDRLEVELSGEAACTPLMIVSSAARCLFSLNKCCVLSKRRAFSSCHRLHRKYLAYPTLRLMLPERC